MTYHRFIRIILIAFALLSIPFIGMQFSTEIAWSPADFGIAGVGLVGAGFIYEIARVNVITLRTRIAVGISIALITCTLWIELAVGLFGSPFAGT